MHISWDPMDQCGGQPWGWSRFIGACEKIWGRKYWPSTHWDWEEGCSVLRYGKYGWGHSNWIRNKIWLSIHGLGR